MCRQFQNHIGNNPENKIIKSMVDPECLNETVEFVVALLYGTHLAACGKQLPKPNIWCRCTNT